MDHKSLAYLQEQNLHSNMQRKAMTRLMGLQFKIVYKKLDPRWLDSPRVFRLKKIFSRRSRKPLNPCPTHTQWHRSSMR